MHVWVCVARVCVCVCGVCVGRYLWGGLVMHPLSHLSQCTCLSRTQTQEVCEEMAARWARGGVAGPPDTPPSPREGPSHVLQRRATLYTDFLSSSFFYALSSSDIVKKSMGDGGEDMQLKDHGQESNPGRCDPEGLRPRKSFFLFQF